MNLISCRRCKSIFTGLEKAVICPSCEKEIEKLFGIVKEYLQENPGASLGVVSDETGVSTKLITKFIKEGRLILTKASPIRVHCMECGAPISIGTRCESCNQKLLENLTLISQTCIEEKKKNIEMHTRKISR